MNKDVNHYQDFESKFGFHDHHRSPDWTLLGRSRHTALLHQFFEQFNNEHVGNPDLLFRYFLEADGRDETREIPLGTMRRTLHRGYIASVDIGVPLWVMMLPEEEFREELCRLIFSGTLSLLEYLRKKEVFVDEETLVRIVLTILEEYRNVELPLEPLPGEDILAQTIIGIPEKS